VHFKCISRIKLSARSSNVLEVPIEGMNYCFRVTAAQLRGSNTIARNADILRFRDFTIRSSNFRKLGTDCGNLVMKCPALQPTTDCNCAATSMTARDLQKSVKICPFTPDGVAGSAMPDSCGPAQPYGRYP
jgi:hypothetical protein